MSAFDGLIPAGAVPSWATLSIGAPVTVNGEKVGEVVDVQPHEDGRTITVRASFFPTPTVTTGWGIIP